MTLSGVQASFGRGLLVLLVTGVLTTTAIAQAGDNAICTSASLCGTTAPSSAFIDASVNTGDICQRIFTSLQGASSGAVIDARGISTGMSCNGASTDTPWQQGTVSLNKPSTILLPSGSITISYGWVLPDGTRLFGEGNNPQGGTKIQVATSSFGTILQMGTASGGLACPSSGQCSGISIEDLMIEGNGLSGVNGILNENAGDSSYVEHVNLHQIEGIGLQVSGPQVAGSGPYANIACGTGDPGTNTPICVKLQASSTRGVHGMSCTTCGGCTTKPCCAMVAGPALMLDGSNNSLEDIHFEGYRDGILVGSQSASSSNVIASVNGGAGANNMTNVIHISDALLNGVTDLSIFGAAAGVSNSMVNITNVIQDDETNTTIPRASSPDETTVAQYVLGDPLSGGYSRFATSPVLPSGTAAPLPLPTWGTGSSAPSGSCPTGSLFTNTSGSPFTLYKCTNNMWS